MKILISTIIRNEVAHLLRWHRQLVTLVKSLPQHEFCLSVFENDSTDGSAQMLASFDYSAFKAHQITSARLNVPYYIGGKEPTRTQLLAYARNRTIYSFEFLREMDSVLVVEPDVEYSTETAQRIVDHERYYGQRFDVFSGKSVHPNSHGIYDSWGSRRLSDQTDWCDEDLEHEKPGEANPMWSTFNCVCMYSAEPIKKGISFSGVNPRTGSPDCDTVAIVEGFRKAGYDKVFWEPALEVTHFCS